MFGLQIVNDYVPNWFSKEVLAGIGLGLLVVVVVLKRGQKKRSPPKDDVLYLHKAPSSFGLASPSPFVLKLEAYLRLRNIAYTPKGWSPNTAPKGKMPYLQLNGEKTGDSGLILDKFEAGTFSLPSSLSSAMKPKLDEGLTDSDIALSHATRRMLEESFYFALVYFRWVDDDGWEITQGLYFGPDSPWVFRKVIIPLFVRPKVKSAVNGQGLGRHSYEDICYLAKQDVTTLSTLLGEKQFFLGKNRPTSIDCAIYAAMAPFIYAPDFSPVFEFVRSKANIVAHVQRMHSLCSQNRRLQSLRSQSEPSPTVKR